MTLLDAGDAAIVVTAGTPRAFYAENVPSGATPTYAIYDAATGDAVTPSNASSVTQVHPGTFRVALTFATPGSLRIRWTLPDGATAEDAIEVVTAEVGATLPTVDDVALLLRTRTVGGVEGAGLGGDTGPQDIGTFTDETRPTSTEVERIIDLAAGAVVGELPPLDAVLGEIGTLAGQVRFAVTVQAAMLVEASFFRDQASDGSVTVWSNLLTSTISAINASITQFIGDTEQNVGTSVVLRSPLASAAAATYGRWVL